MVFFACVGKKNKELEQIEPFFSSLTDCEWFRFKWPRWKNHSSLSIFYFYFSLVSIRNKKRKRSKSKIFRRRRQYKMDLTSIFFFSFSFSIGNIEFSFMFTAMTWQHGRFLYFPYMHCILAWVGLAWWFFIICYAKIQIRTHVTDVYHPKICSFLYRKRIMGTWVKRIKESPLGKILPFSFHFILMLMFVFVFDSIFFFRLYSSSSSLKFCGLNITLIQ